MNDETRTIQQNSLMWPRLTEISKQLVWHGKKYTPEQWKEIFTAMLDGQESVPALEGDGIIFIGKGGTSKRSKKWHIDLETYIEAFCASQGVIFKTDQGLDSYPEARKTKR